jgi:hypothetical protein
MSRGKRREHGRKPSVEVVEFTASLVHAFLVKAASGDKSILVPAVDSPAIATLTDDLIAWQWLVRLERNHIANVLPGSAVPATKSSLRCAPRQRLP